MVPDDPLENLLPDDFWCDALVWLRPASLRNLRLCLTAHLRWLADQGLCWRQAAYRDILEYLRCLVERNLAYASLVVHRWSLSRLYQWAHREGHRSDNPLSRLAPMRKRPYVPVRLTAKSTPPPA